MTEIKPKYGRNGRNSAETKQKRSFSVENVEAFNDICEKYIRDFIINNPIGAVSGTIEIHFKGTKFEFKYQNMRVTE